MIPSILCLAASIGAVEKSFASPTNPINTTNPYAGLYNLTKLSLTSENGSVTQPEGEHPYGRLVLTPELYFISQFNSENYAKHPFTNLTGIYQPGSAADNAAVVRNSLALSGTYRLTADGVYAGLSTTGSTIPNFIDSSVSPPNSTFTLSQSDQLLIETLTTGGSVVEYHWERL